jgi:hypothetical protein
MHNSYVFWRVRGPSSFKLSRSGVSSIMHLSSFWSFHMYARIGLRNSVGLPFVAFALKWLHAHTWHRPRTKVMPRSWNIQTHTIINLNQRSQRMSRTGKLHLCERFFLIPLHSRPRIDGRQLWTPEMQKDGLSTSATKCAQAPALNRAESYIAPWQVAATLRSAHWLLSMWFFSMM